MKHIALLALFLFAFSASAGVDWIPPDLRLSNFSATTAPGVGDDANDGYETGSHWYDETADKAYVCLDATVGAAVWTETTGASGGLTPPGASTDDALVRWDGIGADTVDNSVATLSDAGDMVVNDITVSTPSNIYALSHDSFSGFVAGEHIAEASIDHDALANFDANEHIDHTTVDMGTSATSGLSGGGSIASTRALVAAPELANAGTVASLDEILAADVGSADALIKVTAQSIADLGITDHGALSGLADDDHAGYFWLTGRTGDQTIISSIDASGNFIANSTSNATKGGFFISDSYTDTAHGAGSGIFAGGTGGNNTINSAGTNNIILGGYGHAMTTSGSHSSMIGGRQNTLSASGHQNILLGGWSCSISGGSDRSVVGGVSSIITNSDDSFVYGNANLLSESDSSVISGGAGNYIKDLDTVSTVTHNSISGGQTNYIQMAATTTPGTLTHNHIGGGAGNYVSSTMATGAAVLTHNTVSGGSGNYVTSAIAASATHNSIGGGYNNYINPTNTNDVTYGVIGGGYANYLLAHSTGSDNLYGTIGGGRNNRIQGAQQGTIAGGKDNAIVNTSGSTGISNTIAGGYLNVIQGGADYTAILGNGNTSNNFDYNIMLGNGGAASADSELLYSHGPLSPNVNNVVFAVEGTTGDMHVGARTAQADRTDTNVFKLHVPTANEQDHFIGLQAAPGMTASYTEVKGVADVTLTKSQVRTLFTTEIELVPAPGAGKWIDVEEVQLFADYDDTALDSVGGTEDLQIEYSGGTDIIQVETTGFIDQTNDEWRHGEPSLHEVAPTGESGLNVEDFDNEAVDIRVLNGNLAAADADGNGEVLLRVRVIYTIHTMFTSTVP